MFCSIGLKPGGWAAPGVRIFFSEFAICIKNEPKFEKIMSFDNVALCVQGKVVSRENLAGMYSDQPLSHNSYNHTVFWEAFHH